MDVLKELLAQASHLGAVVVSLLLVYLILRTPFVSKLGGRIFNNQRSNGGSRRDVAGEATVDFWKNEMREIVQTVIDRHEKDERDRHDYLIEALKENRDVAQRTRDTLAALATAIAALTLAIQKVEQSIDRKGG